MVDTTEVQKPKGKPNVITDPDADMGEFDPTRHYDFT